MRQHNLFVIFTCSRNFFLLFSASSGATAAAACIPCESVKGRCHRANFSTRSYPVPKPKTKHEKMIMFHKSQMFCVTHILERRTKNEEEKTGKKCTRQVQYTHAKRLCAQAQADSHSHLYTHIHPRRVLSMALVMNKRERACINCVPPKVNTEKSE